jgi:hypothetical protein
VSRSIDPSVRGSLRGARRTGPIGVILPGDHVEVAREIARLDQDLKKLKALVNSAQTAADDAGDAVDALVIEPPHLEVFWQGPTAPTAVGAFGGVWRVPYLDGASVTFTLDRAVFRFETVPTTAYTLRVEKSAGGSSFSATTVASATIAIAAYEATVTAALGTVDSGQLLRVYCVAVGAGAASYSIQLEGTAP